MVISDNRKLAKLFLIAAAAPLSAALISQYLFGLHPCELCIMQRIPFAVIIFFSVLAYTKPVNKMVLISAVISIHAFLINSGIAFYHVGVEKHWWIHGDCSGKCDMGQSVADIQKCLFSTPAVRCDDVQFEFLGVSMAGWNFLYSLVAGLFFIYVLVKYFKVKKYEPIIEIVDEQ